MSGIQREPSSGRTGNKAETLRFLGVASTVGINLVACTVVGFSIGYFFLDRYLFPAYLSVNSFPLFTIIFSLLGIAAGFLYLFRVARRAGMKKSSIRRL